jgi:hypothetical protein
MAQKMSHGLGLHLSSDMQTKLHKMEEAYSKKYGDNGVRVIKDDMVTRLEKDAKRMEVGRMSNRPMNKAMGSVTAIVKQNKWNGFKEKLERKRI